MKSLSSSIVVLAGAVMVTGGAFVPHDESAMFVQVVGCMVGIAGFVGWYAAWRRDAM